MNIITDIKYIEKYAKEHEKENWDFRAFLKYNDFENLDILTHNLYYKISSIIDCKKCGNCCRNIRPTLNDKDILRFASGLKMNIEIFSVEYITEDKDIPEGKIFNKLPCPFLRNNKCLNYNNRPEACKSYPHLHKNDILSRLWGMIDNYSICPIVFNVYEQLKLELWHISDDEFEDY